MAGFSSAGSCGSNFSSNSCASRSCSAVHFSTSARASSPKSGSSTSARASAKFFAACSCARFSSKISLISASRRDFSAKSAAAYASGCAKKCSISVFSCSNCWKSMFICVIIAQEAPTA